MNTNYVKMPGVVVEPFPPEQRARQTESVVRAVDILRLFLNNDHGLTVTEAARRLGVGKSTVSRLLATMASCGAVVADDDHRYRVGPLAFEVGSRFSGAAAARSVAPMLQELADQTGVTVQLGTLQGNVVLYLAVQQGPSRLRVIAAPGDTRPAHSSAMGKALLAALTDEEIGVLVSSLLDGNGELPPSGPNTIRDPALLRRELDRIRVAGYSFSNEEAAPGVLALGMRVRVGASYPLALSVSFSESQFAESEHARLVDALAGTVTQVGRALGFGEPLAE